MGQTLSAVNTLNLTGIDKRVRHDYVGKYVELEETYTAPPIASVFSFKAVGLSASLGGFFPNNDSTLPTLDADNGTTTNPTPTGDGLSRGTYMESLATAALKAQDDHVLSPPAFPAVNAQTLS